MSLIWWEKTVEYRFVLDSARYNFYIAPLAGKEECAGDAMLSTKIDSWLLIEFKRNFACIENEKVKFPDYEKVKRELLSIDKHHYIVYGMLDEKQEFALAYQTYFSAQPCMSIESLLANGISLNEFKEYLQKLVLSEKKNSGGLSIDKYALVAGINVARKLIRCMCLADFRKEWLQEHVQEVVKTRGSGKSLEREVGD